MVRVSSSIDGD